MSFLGLVSALCGLIYFLAWSASFYPQAFLNWKRKSVVGLSFDYLYYNFTGFFCYTIYNLSLFFSPLIKQEYANATNGDDTPVDVSDVLFACNALVLVSFQIIQCFIYERGNQSISVSATVIVVGCWITIIVYGEFSAWGVSSWLAFMYWLSYIKVFITLVKYIPQVYLNWKRKSTVGWSIWNVLLDFTGGVFSFLQLFVNSLEEGDWSAFTNFAKTALALISIFFDIIFMVQHYLCYPQRKVAGYEIPDEDLGQPDHPGFQKEDSIYEEGDSTVGLTYYQSVKKLFRKFSQDSMAGDASPINNQPLLDDDPTH